ncbi:centrosome-associated protein Alms1a [Aedes albopictus]|uniref:ALMS motif domain-containing protein n=1 Tax=Aedes albopictus TaxID=7160 RepID=A0ABM1ZYM6_AEDAL
MANFSGNSRVTDQIMDYYLKFGQNRDLEKFLRLRASTTRSSSDGSIPTTTGLHGAEAEQRSGGKIGRSLENLSTLSKQKQDEERGARSAELLNASGGSDRSKSGQQQKDDATKEGNSKSDPVVENVVVKETKSEKKSGRNFNFNLESVIEIKLPQMTTVSQPIVVSPPRGILAAAPIIHEISTAGTQTMPEGRSVEQQTEEPIRPIVKPVQKKSGNLNVEETIDSTRDVSPVSSVASKGQRLEWDSLGDIGYNSSDKFYFCGAGDLNETEKRCLQKYFAKKGLNFDEKVVVVKNVQTPRKDGKKVEQQQSDEQNKKMAKQKWQDVYQKYKEKYPNPSDITLSMMNPEAQSTPKVASFQNVPSKIIKSTQTSLVKILTKGVQADQQQPQVDTTDKQVGTETLSSTTNNTISVLGAASVCEQVEVAESFEFFSTPPSEHAEGNSLKSSSDNSSSSRQQQLSSSPGGSSSEQPREYNFEDELRLGVTLYHTICESRSLPARVKQSLVDKIFRKMMKNDPKGRTKEQLLQDCLHAKRQQNQQPSSPLGEDVGTSTLERQAALSGVEKMGESDKSSSVGRSSRGADEVIVEIVDERNSEGKAASSPDDPIVKHLHELSLKSNDARNPAPRSTQHGKQSVASSRCTISSNTNSSNHTARRCPNSMSHSTGPSSGDERIRKAMNEYLQPMTNSEIDYANQKELKRSQEQAKERKNLVSAPSTGDKIFELFRKEKQSQLLKIDKKIEHLKTIKLLLLEEQKTVNDIGSDRRTTYPLELKTRPLPKKPSDEKENLYENTEHRAKSASSAPVYTSVHEDPISEHSNNQGTEFTSGSRSESGWNSHYHMKKLIQNRSKLETPTSDESIATFIKSRKDKFIENYERHRRQMFEDQHHIYTKPYSGRQSKQEHGYSRLDEKYSVRNIAKQKTHLPRSEVFISSDSMSIPAANTLTNTTTHQYDIKSSRSSSESLTLHARPVATQTTGSIMKTKPIFESIPKDEPASVQATGCNCPCNCPCRHRHPSKPPSMGNPVVSAPSLQHTEMIDDTQPRLDKQQQTKPSSIAYVITFQGDKGGKGSKGRKQVSEKDQVYNRSSNTSSDTSSRTNQSDASDLLPPKEQLQRNRPGTLLRLKERQKCVNELNKLRSERNKQRKKLLLLTSDDSLKKSDAKDRLPPPPLAQRRIFSSKAIRENTRRQVRNLPEVLRKKEIEKSNNLKRKNLILRDNFNRKLQQKVLHGQVDLSNSVRVMQ